MKVIFDDVGSYPLPEGITREWVKQAFRAYEENKRRIQELVGNAIRQKLDAGVELPNYPQFQDMISQFAEPILDDSRTEEPFLVREEEARIAELDALEAFAARYKEEKGEKLRIRVCVTGPIELYYRIFQPPVYEDILKNIAKSVQRFVKWSVEHARNYEVACVCVDEPSLGLDPRIEEEGVIFALEISTEFAFKHRIDTQIHLHSPIFYETVLNVRSICVIGVESAANPSYLDLIAKERLEEADKFLRVGVARTDFASMAAEYDEKHNTNVFREGEDALRKVIDEFNSPEIVCKRMKNAFSKFGSRIKYVGADCGLSSFPSQALAFSLLKNIRRGIDAFFAEQAEQDDHD